MRSFKRINNESFFTTSPHNQQKPHHCTIELKTKASSCLHLFHKNSPPVILTTFKNQQSDPNDQQKANNEILWRYQLSQCDLNSKIKTSSQINLNSLRHNYHHHYHYQQQQLQTTNNSSANEPLMDLKFHPTVENKATL